MSDLKAHRIEWMERLRSRTPDAAKNRLRPLVYRWRLLSPVLRSSLSRNRLAPRFIIAGAMKAGTTALFNHIAHHPDFRGPTLKEINFFDFQYRRGLKRYLGHFPRRQDGGIFSGEASTGYLWNPHCAGRIRESLPGVKVLAILRDPVERALSHYFHQVRIGDESRPIEEALRARESHLGYTLTPEEEKIWHYANFGGALSSTRSQALVRDKPLQRAYIGQSRYAEQLEPWRQAFGEDLMLLRYESYFEDPAAHLPAIWRHLGVEDPKRPPPERAFNKGRRSAVSDEVRAYVQDALAEPTRRLTEQLGPDFSW